MSLGKKVCVILPERLQPWFVDDTGAADKTRSNPRWFKFFVEHVPKYGYYPEVEKTWYVFKARNKTITQDEFNRLGVSIKMTRGRSYLTDVSGNAETKDKWLGNMCVEWAWLVSTLAKVTHNYPQIIYGGFFVCFQAKWQHTQWVVTDTEVFLAPMEEATRMAFLPAILVIPAGEIDGNFW